MVEVESHSEKSVSLSKSDVEEKKQVPKQEEEVAEKEEMTPEEKEALEQAANDLLVDLPEDERVDLETEIEKMDAGAVQNFLKIGLPKSIVKGDKTFTIAELTEECTSVGLYFSASWCNPCTEFLPQIKKLYEEINNEKYAKENEGRSETDLKAFEIIFVTCDKNEKEYDEYASRQPWARIAYAASGYFRSKMATFHSIDTIPTLLMYSGEGVLLTSMGVEAMEHDIKFEQFPWKDFQIPLLQRIKDGIMSKLPMIMMMLFMLYRNYTAVPPTVEQVSDSLETVTTTTTAMVKAIVDEL